MEAISSPLMGLFEKRRARSFFQFVQQYDVANPKTWQGVGRAGGGGPGSYRLARAQAWIPRRRP